MLVLPMRSQDSSPNRQPQDCYTASVCTLHRESSPHTSELRKQVADAMLSMMPSTRPPALTRPKLSLQTAIPPSAPTKRLGASLDISTESPTTWNTHANVFEAPPPTPSSAVQPPVIFPSTSITTPSTNPSFTISGNSPMSHAAPYVLPIGAHGILRNSPLPRRHLSAASPRAPRRMFPPVKRVTFQEHLVEIMPTLVIEESFDAELNTEPTEDEHQRRREEIQAEDGHATPFRGRRKRSRREWVWRPLDDDILVQHNSFGTADGIVTRTRTPLPDSAIKANEIVMSDDLSQDNGTNTQN